MRWPIQKKLEIEVPEEDAELPIEVPVSKRKIFTDLADPQIDGLLGKFKRGKLVVQPDFQRQYVWDQVKASKLIKSALLGIPIPIVYLSEEPDNKEYVIDGQQRLTSFFSFIDGQFPSGVDFHLKGLTVFAELNGKKYSELTEPYRTKSAILVSVRSHSKESLIQASNSRYLRG